MPRETISCIENETGDYPLPNFADEQAAQKDAIAVMLNMASETERKIKTLLVRHEELAAVKSSLQDSALFFSKFLGKVQRVYKWLLVVGFVICGFAVACVAYSARVCSVSAKEHKAALAEIKSEYAATSKTLNNEVDSLQKQLVEKYREALNRLSVVYESRLQSLSAKHQADTEAVIQSYDQKLHLLSAQHKAELAALTKSCDDKVQDAMQVLEVAKTKQRTAEAKQAAAEFREKAVRSYAFLPVRH